MQTKIKIKNISKFILATFLVAIIALTVSTGVDMVLAAWDEPGAAPPGDNKDAPLNVGTEDQIKINGGITIDLNNTQGGVANPNDAFSAYANNANSAIYAQQDGTGYAGYFSGKMGVAGNEILKITNPKLYFYDNNGAVNNRVALLERNDSKFYIADVDDDYTSNRNNLVTILSVLARLHLLINLL